MNTPEWLDELALLATRYGYGLGPDLAALTMVEAWGLYRLLRALAEGGG